MLYGHVDPIQYQPAIISAMVNEQYEVAENLAWQFMNTLSQSGDTRMRIDNATELLQAARYIHASKLNEKLANQNFLENSHELAIFCMRRAISCQNLYNQVAVIYNEGTTAFHLRQSVSTQSLENRLHHMRKCVEGQPHRVKHDSKLSPYHAAHAQMRRDRGNSGLSQIQLDTKQKWEAAVVFAMIQQKYDEAEMLALKLVSYNTQCGTGACPETDYATVLLQAVRYIHVSRLYERIAYQEFLRNNFELARVCIRNTISHIKLYNECAQCYSKTTTHFTLQQSVQVASLEQIVHEMSTYKSGHDSMVLAKQQYKWGNYPEADANVKLARENYELDHYPLLQQQYPEFLLESLLASKRAELESMVVLADESLEMLHLCQVTDEHRPQYGD